MKRWVFWLILAPLFAWFGHDGTRAQTRLNFNAQVSPLPSVVVVQYARCAIPSCSGLEYALFKMSDGSTRGPFILVPEPGFTPDVNWTSIPVTIPSGTAVSCAQAKP
jgi:hypothetical protein